MKFPVSQINGLLNRGFISSLKVVRKYPKDSRSYSRGMLVYKHVTSNVTISLLGFKFL